MKILATLQESVNLNRLKGASFDKVQQAFMANYLAALLFLKLQDLKGLKLINDPSHANLKKFSSSMSDLNFWGRSLFYSSDSEIKNRMMNGHAEVLADSAGRISYPRIQKIMNVPLTAPDRIDWQDTISAVALLRYRFDIKSSYLDKILRSIYKWDTLGSAAKQKTINDSFMFLMQSDSQSALLPRLRNLENTMMVTSITSLVNKVLGFKRLHEDGEGGAVTAVSGDASSTASIGTTNNAIIDPGSAGSRDQDTDLSGLYRLTKLSKIQISKKGRFTIRNGKIVKKKVKSLEYKKFKSPDFMKPTKKGIENATK
jgi:Arc/MetJ family transcription regulator